MTLLIHCSIGKLLYIVFRVACNTRITGKSFVEHVRNICNKGFKFSIRPIKEVWTCTKILEKQAALEKRMESMTPEESKEYIAINQQIKELYSILFKRKE